MYDTPFTNNQRLKAYHSCFFLFSYLYINVEALSFSRWAYPLNVIRTWMLTLRFMSLSCIGITIKNHVDNIFQFMISAYIPDNCLNLLNTPIFYRNFFLLIIDRNFDHSEALLKSFKLVGLSTHLLILSCAPPSSMFLPFRLVYLWHKISMKSSMLKSKINYNKLLSCT